MASAITYPQKSTTDRSPSLDWRQIRFPLAASLWPGLAERWAARLFSTPERSTPRAEAADLLAFGHPFRVGRIAAWRWGKGPLVFLAHGWGGHGGQLDGFVKPLVERGFSVVAFDAPAHGVTPGSQASVKDFAHALLALERRLGTPEAVIAHSFGALGALLAAKQGLGARSLVLVAPPSPAARLGWFKEAFSVPDAVLDGARRRVERDVGLSIEAVEPAALARGLTVRALVVHDKRDKEVPVTTSRALASAWPGAAFVETDGLGHRRILHDPAVVERVAAFVAGRTAVSAEAPAETERRVA